MSFFFVLLGNFSWCCQVWLWMCFVSDLFLAQVVLLCFLEPPGTTANSRAVKVSKIWQLSVQDLTGTHGQRLELCCLVCFHPTSGVNQGCKIKVELTIVSLKFLPVNTTRSLQVVEQLFTFWRTACSWYLRWSERFSYWQALPYEVHFSASFSHFDSLPVTTRIGLWIKIFEELWYRSSDWVCFLSLRASKKDWHVSSRWQCRIRQVFKPFLKTFTV